MTDDMRLLEGALEHCKAEQSKLRAEIEWLRAKVKELRESRNAWRLQAMREHDRADERQPPA